MLRVYSKNNLSLRGDTQKVGYNNKNYGAPDTLNSVLFEALNFRFSSLGSGSASEL